MKSVTAAIRVRAFIRNIRAFIETEDYDRVLAIHDEMRVFIEENKDVLPAPTPEQARRLNAINAEAVEKIAALLDEVVSQELAGGDE